MPISRFFEIKLDCLTQRFCLARYFMLLFHRLSRVNAVSNSVLSNFSHNETCISRLIFHRRALYISTDVRHQFYATKVLCTYASKVLVSLSPKMEFGQSPLIVHLSSLKFSCRFFANTDSPPTTRQRICISWLYEVFLK